MGRHHGVGADLSPSPLTPSSMLGRQRCHTNRKPRPTHPLLTTSIMGLVFLGWVGRRQIYCIGPWRCGSGRRREFCSRRRSTVRSHWWDCSHTDGAVAPPKAPIIIANILRQWRGLRAGKFLNKLCGVDVMQKMQQFLHRRAVFCIIPIASNTQDGSPNSTINQSV